jgi:hypothetical protein
MATLFTASAVTLTEVKRVLDEETFRVGDFVSVDSKDGMLIEKIFSQGGCIFASGKMLMERGPFFCTKYALLPVNVSHPLDSLTRMKNVEMACEREQPDSLLVQDGRKDMDTALR